MCVVSMVMDHYKERWTPYIVPTVPFTNPNTTRVWPQQAQFVVQSPITQAEVDEFRRLLERAREYDRRHQEPDCELDEKRQALKTLAGQLGIDISFVDQPTRLPIPERRAP